MKAVNVPPFISFGYCTNIIASSQFVIQQWKLELSANEFCNTDSWLPLPKVLLATAKTKQYNNGADGACPRRDINCSFYRERNCLCHYISLLSCWPKSLRVTILDPLYFSNNYKPYITPHWGGLPKEKLSDLEASHILLHVKHPLEVNLTCSGMLH